MLQETLWQKMLVLRVQNKQHRFVHCTFCQRLPIPIFQAVHSNRIIFFARTLHALTQIHVQNTKKYIQSSNAQTITTANKFILVYFARGFFFWVQIVQFKCVCRSGGLVEYEQITRMLLFIVSSVCLHCNPGCSIRYELEHVSAACFSLEFTFLLNSLEPWSIAQHTHNVHSIPKPNDNTRNTCRKANRVELTKEQNQIEKESQTASSQSILLTETQQFQCLFFSFFFIERLFLLCCVLLCIHFKFIEACLQANTYTYTHNQHQVTVKHHFLLILIVGLKIRLYK